MWKAMERSNSENENGWDYYLHSSEVLQDCERKIPNQQQQRSVTSYSNLVNRIMKLATRWQIPVDNGNCILVRLYGLICLVTWPADKKLLFIYSLCNGKTKVISN